MKKWKLSFVLFIVSFIMIGFGAMVNHATALAETTDSSDMTFNGFEYSILEDSSIKITHYSGSDKEVVIPAEIDGKPVTGIGGLAFNNCSELVSVIIPNSVVFIEDGDEYYGAFAFCTSLTNVTLPNSITYIGSDAFHNCKKLTEISLPNSVTTIGFAAFQNCSNLARITLPSNFTCNASNIASLFSGCNNLTEIIVSSNDGNFSSQDGVLFDKDKTKIFCFPDGKKGAYTIPDSVTTIGKSAFNNCTGLTNVTIPDSVTTIEAYAFNNCTDLTNVTIPNSIITIGESAFNNCTGLTNVTISDSVTTIEAYTFSGCTELIQITLSNHLTKIGRSAFSGCSKLPNIIIPDSVTDIGEKEDNGEWHFDNGGVFSGCSYLTDITLSSNLEYIAPCTFYGCSRLKTVTIPDSVTSIGESAFSNSGLTSITIPGKVANMGDQAFYNCSLVNLTILDGVTDLGDSAFENCEHLTNVTLPQTLEKIGYDTFKKCSKLKTISIPDTVSEIGGGAFDRCTSLANVNIPLGVSCIYNETFNKCTSLTSITIPDSVTSIGRISSDGYDGEHSLTGAFSYCENLTDVSLPDTLETIGTGTFFNCSNLTSISIPDSVTAIGAGAFSHCRLNNITLSKRMEKIEEYTFSNCDTKSITIPDSVTTIETGAFRYAGLAGGITLSKNITCIEELAFEGCSLRTLELPDSLTEIKTRAFQNSGLVIVTIPDSVTDIGDEAFSNCPLSSVILHPSVARMGFGVFSSSGFYYNEPIDIYYIGTEDDWKKIICPYFDEDAPGGVKIHYNNTFPTFPSQITLNAPSEITLTYGSTYSLSATMTPSNATVQKVLWFADVGGIVQISKDGTLTAIGESLGTTTVTAMTANGIPSTSSINVTVIANDGEHIHTETIEEGFPATCTSDGYTDGIYCSDCGLVLQEQDNIPATGHQWGTWETVKLPTSATDGEKIRLCSVCNETEHQTIPKTGTDMGTPTNKPQTSVPPTKPPAPSKTPTPAVTKTPQVNQGTANLPLPQIKKITAKNKKKKAVTLSWKKVKNASWYEIQYSTNKKFKSCKKYKVKKTTATIKKLKKKKTYYFRIRAYKTDGQKKVYGKWSATKKVKIKK